MQKVKDGSMNGQSTEQSVNVQSTAHTFLREY